MIISAIEYSRSRSRLVTVASTTGHEGVKGVESHEANDTRNESKRNSRYYTRVTNRYHQDQVIQSVEPYHEEQSFSILYIPYRAAEKNLLISSTSNPSASVYKSRKVNACFAIIVASDPDSTWSVKICPMY